MNDEPEVILFEVREGDKIVFISSNVAFAMGYADALRDGEPLIVFRRAYQPKGDAETVS